MLFNWIQQILGLQKHKVENRSRWPDDLPRLYPDLDGKAMSRMLVAGDYDRICQFPLVVVLPIASQRNTQDEIDLGTGLSRLLIRDLMLVRNISVLGPEDVRWS